MKALFSSAPYSKRVVCLSVFNECRGGKLPCIDYTGTLIFFQYRNVEERGGSVVDRWTTERKVGCSKPTFAVLCP